MDGKIVLFSALAVLSLISGASAAQKRFDNYGVYSVKIEGDSQVQALDGLWRTFSSDIDYWRGSNTINTVAEIMVSPEDQQHFETVLRDGEFKWQRKVEDVQSLIDEAQPKTIRPRADGDMDWESYHSLDSINAWVDKLLVQYPDILTGIEIGKSVEGRPIRGVKLSRKTGNKVILIEANTHAREWITSATATHFLNELLTSTDPEMVAVSTNFDWVIFYMHNPDGYQYSWDTNRMWRKNRARHGLICLGVDPNRNWAHEWVADGNGSSNNNCVETYAGPSPHSEPEVAALADYMKENKDAIAIYLSFHSYSQLILYPWSYTQVPVEDSDLLHELAEISLEAIKDVHGTEYVTQPSNALYPHHGTSVDYAYGTLGIKLSYTYEFRDTGSNGFILPADQIIPNAEEVEKGVIALINAASERNLV